ncbi:UBA domain-containing protein [Erysiphe necator]|nr:UBA domain-containing protein [Erysiphe necator]
MDDLSGLDWSVAPSVANRGPAGTISYLPSKQPNISPRNLGNSLPISISSSSYGKSVSTSSPAFNTKTIDSFSNLISFGSPKESTLTLQQRQQKLDAEKKKQAIEKQNLYNMQFGNSQFWDNIETKSLSQNYAPSTTYQNSTPMHASSFIRQRSVSPPVANGIAIVGHGEDKDLFAAFNSETRVDVSSHFPPPPIDLNKDEKTFNSNTRKPLDLSKPQAWGKSEPSADLGFCDDDGDDPFGLNEVKPSYLAPFVSIPNKNEENLLGDFSKPVEELKGPKIYSPEPILRIDSNDEDEISWNAALKKLVKMGFSVEDSRRALVESNSKLNIQAAVNWILGHEQVKTPIQNPRNNTSRINEGRDTYTNKVLHHDSSPKVLYEPTIETKYNPPKPKENFDISRDAVAVGNNLFKTANTLWKTSQKKVHKVVSEFQQQDSASDPSQPKWMRNNAVHRDLTRRLSIVEGRDSQPKTEYMTDEARLLESTDQSPGVKVGAPMIKKFNPNLSKNQFSNTSRMLQPAGSPESRQRQSFYQEYEPKNRSTRQESEQTYISPARRKKKIPLASTIKHDSESSYKETSSISDNIFPISKDSIPKPTKPLPIKPKPKPRNLPYISSASLQLSTQHRLAGTAHYKRGDFASAYKSYSSSLDVLPPMHPINIVLLCNRALTSLKNGVPKSAILDADKALELIGQSRGDGEIIDLGTGQEGGTKQMKIFYGKALLRKAEALEQMERWKDAGEIWKKCVEQGIGGSTAAEGRTRCEKLLDHKPSIILNGVRSQINSRPRPARKPSFRMNNGDSAAIKRLREANEKAELADNQKLELIDKVDARIALWKDGKSDNLRALLGSLDAVLWEGSGWKNVGLHELIQNNKVKIHYMKAIGKTHPDKLPQDASMEVRMIAAQIFATLNECWDTFKKQNGM